ncbi:hypothetical protein PC116_g20296 [Phytophthora cactorum]|uniref:Uncharacterized protein n=1 Tax=Phytophthora cactorum TaxID=29920 RepID=A0A329SUV9_9STRA|nr:hypothetical protein PC112_g2150 [Phytophthora cactorum]KAG2845311.1 hypothetical protein PC111_g1629 [Phytophthora cactorum]KAG2867061.1 hypothetical protein PC113_g2322 [Phytophthora cactorum]KAG2930493.1 hypothetical protein PC114_g2442 [Phytophthora cactorum]KAG2943442.1 hypothetical protein PC115_g826 [Phytophthora cactorum]
MRTRARARDGRRNGGFLRRVLLLRLTGITANNRLLVAVVSTGATVPGASASKASVDSSKKPAEEAIDESVDPADAIGVAPDEAVETEGAV